MKQHQEEVNKNKNKKNNKRKGQNKKERVNKSRVIKPPKPAETYSICSNITS